MSAADTPSRFSRAASAFSCSSSFIGSPRGSVHRSSPGGQPCTVGRGWAGYAVLPPCQSPTRQRRPGGRLWLSTGGDSKTARLRASAIRAWSNFKLLGTNIVDFESEIANILPGKQHLLPGKQRLANILGMKNPGRGRGLGDSYGSFLQTRLKFSSGAVQERPNTRRQFRARGFPLVQHVR